MSAYLVFPNHNPSNGGSAQVFLEGAMVGHWHEDAIGLLTQKAKHPKASLRICCPKPLELFAWMPPCTVSHREPYWEMHQPFPSVRHWSAAQREAAAHAAGILFWFPKAEVWSEHPFQPSSSDILWEWVKKKKEKPALRIAIGFEGEPPSMLAAVLGFCQMVDIEVLQFPTLDELCEQAIKWEKEGFIV